MGASAQEQKKNKTVQIEVLPQPPMSVMEQLKFLFKDKELPKHAPYLNTGVEG